MQAVDGPAGLHLDLDSTDRPAAVDRAGELGASPRLDLPRRRGDALPRRLHVLPDAGGRRLRPWRATGRRSSTRSASTSPAAHWDAEVAFWAALTGREPQVGALPHFARLVEDGRLRLLLQRLDEPDGPVRAHPDLATADRAADTARHVELGASGASGCTTSGPSSPRRGGQVYCLTDRDPTTGTASRCDRDPPPAGSVNMRTLGM